MITDKRIAAEFKEIQRRAAAFKQFCESGRLFTGIRRPKGYRQRKAKQCFSNAQILAMEGRGDYVEGVCVTPTLGIPIHHGWITLDGVHAIDPTFPDGECCLYFGIAFDRVELAKSLVASEFYQPQLNLAALGDLPPQLREVMEREDSFWKN